MIEWRNGRTLIFRSYHPRSPSFLAFGKWKDPGLNLGNPAGTFPITDLSKYTFEMLSEDGEFGLSRGALDGAPSLLVVAPVSAQPSAKSLTHLEHAYALRDELDRETERNPRSAIPFSPRPPILPVSSAKEHNASKRKH